jgi:prepilin-type N-terminal cleavage/methylation domain-containing protein
MIIFKFKAFTLVELLVVIAIVGLLSTVVLVVTNNLTNQGRIAKGLQFDQYLQNSLGLYVVGRWNFNEESGSTIYDSSGWNKNGTLAGSPLPVRRCANLNVDYTPSGQGCSLEFDGIESYVNYGASPMLYGSALSISVWAYPKTSRWIGFLRQHASPQGIWIDQYTNAGFKVTINDSANSDNILWTPSDQRMIINQWNHVVFTFNNGIFKYYLNGKLSYTKTMGDTSILSGGSFLLGQGGRTSLNERFEGLFDEVSIYHTALTASQIQSQYYVGLNKLLTKRLINEEEYQTKLSLINQ